MKPRPFKYFKPGDLDEALGLLAEHQDEAKILAGGQSLMPLLNMRLAAPEVLIDINGLVDLDYLKAVDDGIAVGALARQRRLESEDLVREHLPVLVSAAGWMSHPQIKNRGTIVGSICHGDPSAELPAVALVTDAELTARSSSGVREIAAAELYFGFYATSVNPDELVTEVRFPFLPARTGWSVKEVSRRHGDFALAGVVALVTLDRDSISQARLACFGLGGAAERFADAEALLSGQAVSEQVFDAAARAIGQSVSPADDIHASGDYRRGLAVELTRRALREAAERAADRVEA